MERTLNIGGADLRMRASALIPRLYRFRFGRDLIKDMSQLEKAYKKAEEIEKIIGDELEYAFDERIGFLTQCPTNLGTGMRASVMLHLPALTLSGQIHKLINTVSKLGLTFRGAFGEGTNAVGDMYQLSNQITLGISEEFAIKN